VHALLVALEVGFAVEGLVAGLVGPGRAHAIADKLFLLGRLRAGG
jgi:hypothetical protein